MAARADVQAGGWSLPAARPHPRAASRVPIGAMGAVVAGLLAFVLIVVGTTDRHRTALVAVAAHDIAPGQVVTGVDLRQVAVPADSPIRRTLVGASIAPGAGLVAGHRIIAGAPIAQGDLVASAAPGGLRSMSLAVPVERANDGHLQAGDCIDVINAAGDRATYIATGLEVLAVADAHGGGLSSPQAFSVSVAVNADQALALADALAGGKVALVRSTGATAAPPTNPASAAAATSSHQPATRTSQP